MPDQFIDFVNSSLAPTAGHDEFIETQAAKGLCHALESSINSGDDHILIKAPPGSGKSTIASVLWPCWLWGPAGYPGLDVMSVSFHPGIARRDSEEAYKVVAADNFRSQWPAAAPLDDRGSALRIENQGGGSRLAMSTGDALMGQQFDLVILDDMIDPRHEVSDDRLKEYRRYLDEHISIKLRPRNGTGLPKIVMVISDGCDSGFSSGLVASGNWKQIDI